MTITALSKSLHADTTHPRYLERLGSAGIARSDVDVRIVDADDRDLPPVRQGAQDHLAPAARCGGASGR
jgi:hypothetical protein